MVEAHSAVYCLRDAGTTACNADDVVGTPLSIVLQSRSIFHIHHKLVIAWLGSITIPHVSSTAVQQPTYYTWHRISYPGTTLGGKFKERLESNMKTKNISYITGHSGIHTTRRGPAGPCTTPAQHTRMYDIPRTHCSYRLVLCAPCRQVVDGNRHLMLWHLSLGFKGRYLLEFGNRSRRTIRCFVERTWAFDSYCFAKKIQY